ncbi:MULTISPECIES: NUDIX hydrolase [unclassified Pseudomonas]|uniref:NUDIX hydrolase n=1 Tax=unclassified Pseudomonas TaxID=196821 RepID=UPI0008398923|nr:MULTISPECIES: NUDIX hydrolase [unclassified Pseudomonas]QIH09740.1 NUDIX hydrolase [Pseudomonas sp. BIOMIG1BAC]
MESSWLTHAKRLQAIASTGLHFCKDIHDRERYQEIADIAHQMLAQLGNVPLERITGLVADFAQRYSTPMVEVRGALIENDKILLVRETTDDLWALPGGYADVGLSASENVIKEIHEEAGIEVTVRGLYGIRHKAKGPYKADHRDFYKLYFLCERQHRTAPVAGSEASEAAFFALDQLPQLSQGRTVERDIREAFDFHQGKTVQVQFD